MTRTLTYIGAGIISQGLNLIPNETYEVSDKAYKYFLDTFPTDFIEFMPTYLEEETVSEVETASEVVNTKSTRTRKSKSKVEAE